MKRICILGPIDKRIITYPLIKVLDLTGKLLVVSDDACFRRFADDLGTEFMYGQSQFLITPTVTKDYASSKGYKEDEYDFVLYTTTNERFDDVDALIYCHGINKSMLDEVDLEFLEELPHKEVIISPNKIPVPKGEAPKESKAIKIDLLKDCLHYVYTCEENRSFMYQSKPGTSLPKVLEELVGDVIGLKADKIGKILERGE